MKTNNKISKSGAVLIPQPWVTADFKIKVAGENYYYIHLLKKAREDNPILRFLPPFQELEDLLPKDLDLLDFEPFFDIEKDALCWLIHAEKDKAPLKILLYADGNWHNK